MCCTLSTLYSLPKYRTGKINKKQWASPAICHVMAFLYHLLTMSMQHAFLHLSYKKGLKLQSTRVILAERMCRRKKVQHVPSSNLMNPGSSVCTQQIVQGAHSISRLNVYMCLSLCVCLNAYILEVEKYNMTQGGKESVFVF